jgi:hypothetical protein
MRPAALDPARAARRRAVIARKHALALRAERRDRIAQQIRRAC